MTTPIVPTLTDELIAELEESANQATHKNWAGRGDEIGYISHEDDQSYGMFCPLAIVHSERNVDYISMVTPRLILALLAERADLKRQLAAASITAENCETFRRNAERYLFLRNLHYDLMGSAGIPCAAIPSSGISGVYANGHDLDAAVDAARDIAAMDIGSGD